MLGFIYFIIWIFYFIDKTKYEITFLLRGANTLAKCSGDYVVQYFDHWIENNDCLYIQMELCSDNLKNIIQQKQQFFRKEKSDPIETDRVFHFVSIIRRSRRMCQIFARFKYNAQRPQTRKYFNSSKNSVNRQICQIMWFWSC